MTHPLHIRIPKRDVIVVIRVVARTHSPPSSSPSSFTPPRTSSAIEDQHRGAEFLRNLAAESGGHSVSEVRGLAPLTLAGAEGDAL